MWPCCDDYRPACIFLTRLLRNQCGEIEQIHPACLEQYSISNNSIQLIECTIVIAVNKITFYSHSKQTGLQMESPIDLPQEIGEIN